MGPGILKAEEMNRLRVISLLFTGDLLEGMHVALGESPSSRGAEESKLLKQGAFMPCNRFFYILTVCLYQPYFPLLALDTLLGIKK